jgi:hypothetical protein
MRKQDKAEELWETPSLEWIHRVRTERQAERKGRTACPPTQKESEKLAKKYGLKLAGHVSTKR